MTDSRTRSTRPTATIVAGVVGLLVGLAFGILLDPGDTDPPEPTPSTQDVMASEPPTTAAPTETATEDGCTEDAAVLAAVEWMERFTSELYLDDDARRAAVSEIAAASAEEELQTITADIAERLRDAGLTEEIAAGGLRVGIPVGYQIVSFVPEEATIAMWVASVLHLGEVSPLSTSWDTQTTTMACESGEWKLVAIDTVDGPVPEVTAQGDGELDPTLEVIESFTEFTDAP